MLGVSSDKPVQVDEKALASMKEEEEIKIEKNFELVDMSNETIWATKKALFETRFDDAEALLAPYAMQNLWAMSVHVEGAVIRFMLEKRPEQLEAAVIRLRTAAAQAVVLIKRYKMKSDKKHLAKDPEKGKLLVEAMAHEAHAYMILAMVLIVSNSYVKGAFYTRKSWKCWELTQKAVADLAELGHPASDQLQAFCHFGMGFFFFGVSLVPANLEFLVKLLGFQGDRLKAAVYLEQSRKVPSCGKSIESGLMLYAMRFWFTDERESAPELLAQLREELPESPLLCFMAGWQAMICNHDSDAALEQYKAGAAAVQMDQLRVLFSTSLAWCHFVREDWDDVVRLLEAYLESAKPGENHSYSSFNLAVAQHMKGNDARCAELMQNVLDFEKKANNWDSYASSVARSYLSEKTFDRVTLLLLLAENANEAGRPEKAIEYLDEVDGLPEWKGMTEDDKTAMSSYFRGVALRLLKQYDKAKSCLIKCAGMHHKPLSLEARRAVPYALVVLGEMAMRELGQLEGAGRFFAKAKSYDKKYLFSEILMFRLKSDEEVLADKKRKAALIEDTGQ